MLLVCAGIEVLLRFEPIIKSTIPSGASSRYLCKYWCKTIILNHLVLH